MISFNSWFCLATWLVVVNAFHVPAVLHRPGYYPTMKTTSARESSATKTTKFNLNNKSNRQRKESIHVMQAFLDPTTILMSKEVEEWRQYVPLVVSGGVIIDVLLGSPMANAVLKPLRGAQDNAATGGDDGDDGEKDGNVGGGGLLGGLFGGGRAETSGTGSKGGSQYKERVDSEQITLDVIERAKGALELKKFLDEQKTDWDRMEEMKRKLDEDMQDIDKDLAARQEELSKRGRVQSSGDDDDDN